MKRAAEPTDVPPESAARRSCRNAAASRDRRAQSRNATYVTTRDASASTVRHVAVVARSSVGFFFLLHVIWVAVTGCRVA